MASCGICREPVSYSRKFYCPSCASYLTLDDRISLVNASKEHADLVKLADRILVKDLVYSPWNKFEEGDGKLIVTKRNIRLLNTRVDSLQSQLARTKQQRRNLQNQAQQARRQVQVLKSENDTRREILEEQRAKLEKEMALRKAAVVQQTTSLRAGIHSSGIAISELQTKLIKDLAAVFGIRKRRKKKDKSIRPEHYVEREPRPNALKYDIIIGFSILPDLTKLVHYSASTVNLSIERLAFFTALLASYLKVQLPFELGLPHRSHPFVRMGNASKGTKQSLYTQRSLTTLAQEHVQEYEGYAEGLAMLACCLAEIARNQGIPVMTVEEFPQVNRILSKLYRRLVPRNEERVPRSNTPDLGPSPSPSTGDISEQLMLRSIRDHIITQTYLEINGESAEWNLVDYEAAVGSLVDINEDQDLYTVEESE